MHWNNELAGKMPALPVSLRIDLGVNEKQGRHVKAVNHTMKTKRFFPLKLLSGSIAVMAIGLATQAFAQSETLVSSTIVRMKGHARCSTDGGKTWRMVKAGDTLASGSMIQTAFKSDLDIVLGGQARPSVDGSFYNPETQPANLVSLSEDTLLRIDKTAKKRAAGSQESLEEFSLDLRTGTITGNVTKLSPASRYEIAFVHGVAGTREGIYTLRANGEMSVLKGKAFMALTDGRPAKEIAAGQQFNPATGMIATLPPQATQSPAGWQPAPTASDASSVKPAPHARKTASPKDVWNDVRAGQNPIRSRQRGYLGPGVCYSEEVIGYMLAILNPEKDAKEIADLKERKKKLDSMGRAVTPILIPLEPTIPFSGLVNSNANIVFDLDGSGMPRQWGWTTPKAAWLVFDSKGDGKITSALQMFGSVTFWIFWQDGYAALASLDDDGDSALRGLELSNLALWQDRDGNGVSDSGEVLPLQAAGIIAISCRSQTFSGEMKWNPDGVTFTDGEVRPTYDWIVPSN